MPRNRVPPSANSADEVQTEGREEEEEQVDADAGNREDAGDGESDEEESSEKTMLKVRGLGYGSDGDSGRTFPSPTASSFVIEQNSKTGIKSKKRAAGSDLTKEKSEVKKIRNEKKRKRKGNGAVAEDGVAKEDKAKRTTGSQRIWGPEDELIILNGMVDFKEELGVDRSSNLDDFYKYINESLNAVVDKNQLASKIRKLKEKYRSNAQKKANGEAPVFVKGHEAEAYELSKKIWGSKAVGQGSQSTKGKPNVVSKTPLAEMDSVLASPVRVLEASTKEVNGVSAKVGSRVPEVVRKMDLDEADLEIKYSAMSMPVLVDNFVVEKGLELVEKSKLDALNEKWRKYQFDAAHLYLRKLDLVHEQTKLILDALKSNT